MSASGIGSVKIAINAAQTWAFRRIKVEFMVFVRTISRVGFNIMTSKSTFRGNKQSLPHKPCQQCGLEMVWRKSWAKNWDAVKYCSERCRAAAKSA
jgi:hypothetical protein